GQLFVRCRQAQRCHQARHVAELGRRLSRIEAAVEQPLGEAKVEFRIHLEWGIAAEGQFVTIHRQPAAERRRIARCWSTRTVPACLPMIDATWATSSPLTTRRTRASA